MNDEQLLECVRKYEVVYDLSHKKYMDVSYKNDVWNKIGEQMKTDGPVCKTRWNNIRDTYRKSLKKGITTSGQSAKKIKKYKYADQLDFLKKYFDERETKTNIDSQEDQQDEENDQLNQVLNEEELALVPEENLQSQPSPSSVQGKEQPSLQVSAKSMKQKPKTLIPQQTAAARLMDYLINKNENQVHVQSPHPVDAFLAGIAPTLKTFSRYNLHLAKSEIFAVIQKYELKTIVGESSHGQSDFHPACLSTSSTSNSTPLPSPDQGFEHIPPDQNTSSSSFHGLQNYFQNYQTD